MSTTTKTLAEFVAEHELTADVERAADNPNAISFGPDARHWLVTIHSGVTGESMAVPFSQGSGLTEDPTLEDVLDCLASDASSIQGEEFETWAEEMGFFPVDSAEELRQAQRTFALIDDQADALANVIGVDAFNELLYDVERQ